MGKMTAKVAMKVLKGERAKTLREFANLKLQEQRVRRAGGVDNVHAIEAAEARVKEAYEYALASLTLSRASGKSALKECARQGLVVEGTGSGPSSPPPAPSRSPDEEYDPGAVSSGADYAEGEDDEY